MAPAVGTAGLFQTGGSIATARRTLNCTVIKDDIMPPGLSVTDDRTSTDTNDVTLDPVVSDDRTSTDTNDVTLDSGASGYEGHSRELGVAEPETDHVVEPYNADDR